MASVNPKQSFLSEVPSALITEYVSALIDRERDARSLYWHHRYLDLFIKTHREFGMKMLPNNSLIDDELRLEFSKQFLNFCDMLADVSVHHIHPDAEERLEQARNTYQSQKPAIPFGEPSSDEWRAYFKMVRRLAGEWRMEISQVEQELKKVFIKLLAVTVERMVGLINKCPSQVEAAFLIGILSYGEESMFTLLMTPNLLEAQAMVSGFGLDFVLCNAEKNFKLGIEIEADVQKATGAWEEPSGFTVLRFDRQEILNDLKGCIDRVVQAYRAA